jgi:hypothetical protein
MTSIILHVLEPLQNGQLQACSVLQALSVLCLEDEKDQKVTIEDWKYGRILRFTFSVPLHLKNLKAQLWVFRDQININLVYVNDERIDPSELEESWESGGAHEHYDADWGRESIV